MRCFVARESSEAVLSSQLGRTAAGRARGNIGTRPTRMGTRLHGMASRAEEIELNRGRSRKNLVGGTDGSNLVPSSSESATKLASCIAAVPYGQDQLCGQPPANS